MSDPITRKEKYLAKLAGSYSGDLPDPVTREDRYLYKLCTDGVGVSPEDINKAVNAYLAENPVKPGATAEQAQQIEQNKTDIASLKVETGSLKKDLEDLTNNNELFSRKILGADLHSYVMKNGVEYEIPIENVKGDNIGTVLYTKDYNLIKIALESIRCNRRELEHLPFDNTLKIIDFGEIVPGYKPKERIKLFEYAINQGYSSASEASSTPVFGGDNNLYYETDGHLRLSYYTWASPTSDKPYLFTSYKIFSTIYQ